MEQIRDDLARLANNAVIFPAEGALIEFTGADRRDWLQGQITQDIRKLTPWGSIRACLCTPTGQLVADLVIWDLENRLLVGTHPFCADAVLKRVADMVIMEDVEARRVEGALVSIQGPAAGEHLEGAELALENDRSGFGGYDIWGEIQAHTLPEISAEAAEIARIEAGIPKLGAEIDSRTLPPELGQAFISSRISYSKGCYTGQEVLMRIHSRGHTNRTLVGLRLSEPAGEANALGDAGTITSAAVSPTRGPIALAMVRNEFAAVGTEIGNATVAALPFE